MDKRRKIVDREFKQEVDYATVNHLKSKQYWRDNFCNNSATLSVEFDANDASTLAPSISRHRSQDKRYLFYDSTKCKYITEYDAIREVLFVLSGRPSFLFQQDSHGIFKVILNANLTHLTCGTQAFAASVLKMISKFDKLLSDLEFKYCIDNMKSQEIFNESKCSINYDDKTLFNNNNKSLMKSASEITCNILSKLFTEVSHHQTIGNKSIFLIFAQHLDNTLKQFPDFLSPLVSRILFSGKARNLLMTLKSNENIDKYVENLEDVKGNNNHSDSDNDIFDKYENTKSSKDNNKNDNTSSQSNHDGDGETIRLLEIGKLPDMNQIVDIYPKVISYQFPLLLLLTQSKTKKEGNTTTTATKSELNVSLPRYEKIGQQLYKALVRQCDLWKHLKALSGMYFMLQGESMHQLCDIIFDRIDKKQVWYDGYVINHIFLNVVENFKWLDKNLVSAWIDDDDSTKRPNTTTVNVFEKIVIDYRTLKYYKRIIIFLLQAKRAKYLLERLAFTRIQSHLEKTAAMILFYGVRIKLLWFLNTIYDYTMRTILHSETENFHKKMKQIFDVDEMVKMHEQFIQTTYDRCLLNEKAKPIHNSILDVFNLTIQFTTLYTRYQEDDQWIRPNKNDNKPLIPSIVDYEDFLQGLTIIDKEFNRHKEFITDTAREIAKVGGFWWLDSLALSLG
nr:10464_t:CDS:10 [Entrophospora candida]